MDTSLTRVAFSKIIKRKIEISREGCWLIKNVKTIPTINYEGKNIKASRLSYELFHKKELGKLLACHNCDNLLCINPEHLFAGTATDSFNEAVKRGKVKPIYDKERTKKIKAITKVKKEMRERLTFCGDFGHGY